MFIGRAQTCQTKHVNSSDSFMELDVSQDRKSTLGQQAKRLYQELSDRYRSI